MLRCVSLPVLRPAPPRRHPGAVLETQHHGLCHALHDPGHERVHFKGEASPCFHFHCLADCISAAQITRAMRVSVEQPRSLGHTTTIDYFIYLCKGVYVRDQDRRCSVGFVCVRLHAQSQLSYTRFYVGGIHVTHVH